MIRWLFRKWVGEDHPFYCYPGKWWSHENWVFARNWTLFSSWLVRQEYIAKTSFTVENWEEKGKKRDYDRLH